MIKKFEDYKINENNKDNELVGKRIQLIKMDNDPNPIKPGTKGTVKFVDDIGQIHVKWDNGRTLALIPEEDEYEIIKESLYETPIEIGKSNKKYSSKYNKTTKTNVHDIDDENDDYEEEEEENIYPSKTKSNNMTKMNVHKINYGKKSPKKSVTPYSTKTYDKDDKNYIEIKSKFKIEPKEETTSILKRFRDFIKNDKKDNIGNYKK